MPIFDERKINWGNPQTELLPVYSIPAAAGYGEQLDDNIDNYKIEVPINENTKKADFVIRVSGDSMEPQYSNDDMLLIKRQETVDMNDIGIFVVNNEGYVKRYGGDKLISVNPKYEDIKIGEFDSFKCIGKVLGKV